MMNALDISTSALVAQRTRLDAISSNIANVSTTRNEKGELEPYQAKHVIFQTDSSVATPGGGVGVKVAEMRQSGDPPKPFYNPNHPDADPETGNVNYPAIDMMTEFVDALSATRAYEANLGVIEITKDLAAQSLRIIA